jgi:hypothetical protein
MLYTAASFDTAASFALALGPAEEPIVAPAGRHARTSDATRFRRRAAGHSARPGGFA